MSARTASKALARLAFRCNIVCSPKPGARSRISAWQFRIIKGPTFATFQAFQSITRVVLELCNVICKFSTILRNIIHLKYFAKIYVLVSLVAETLIILMQQRPNPNNLHSHFITCKVILTAAYCLHIVASLATVANS